MIIVVEGPDGSGKSTLIDQLFRDLNCATYHSGGPKTLQEMSESLESLSVLANSSELYIVDRTPWFSELVYSIALSKPMIMHRAELKKYWSLPQAVVLCSLETPEDCVNNMSLAHKAHKPFEHTNKVVTHFRKVFKLYQDLFDQIEKHPITSYRYNWKRHDYNHLLQWSKECVDSLR